MVIVSLLLAVMTIGAVAAYDVNLAADGDGVSVEETPVGEVISSDEDGDEVGLVSDDFKANMTEEIDLADSETEVAEAYYPEGVQGNLNLELVNADDLTDAYSDVKSLSDYTVGDKITFKIASDKLSKGKYNAKLTNVDNDNVIVLKETVIEISNLTKDDFNIVYGKDIAVQDEGLVVQLWQIPAKGTIIVSVDGEKRYARDVNKDGSAYVFLDDLKLEDGKQYSIRVAFNTTLGREIELATFDMNASYGSYWYRVYDADVYYGEDFNGYDVAYFASNNRKIVGMLKFYVNNVEKFSHNIVSTDYKLGEDGEGLTYKACPIMFFFFY